MIFKRELEKQIVELKKENAELEGQVTRAFEVLEGKRKKIEELEKENTILKKQLEALSGDIPWKELKDVSEVTKKLTEAKEIIKGLLSCARNYQKVILKKMQRAENFLKEVVE